MAAHVEPVRCHDFSTRVGLIRSVPYSSSDARPKVKGGSSESFLDTDLTDFPVPSAGLSTHTKQGNFPENWGGGPHYVAHPLNLLELFVHI